MHYNKILREVHLITDTLPTSVQITGAQCLQKINRLYSTTYEDKKKITNLREPTSRNAGKIVMLVVIPYIEGQQIEGAIIRIGLLTFDKHVVF